jgi:energy-coupling factor transport system ATP-binding protein
MMADLRLEGLAGRHPLDLSVGQRERVALAAVLVAEPGVILLDEPTRGMDPEGAAALAALLRRRAAAGAAVLVATHDPVFAAALADRRLLLRDGRLEPASARPAVAA